MWMSRPMPVTTRQRIAARWSIDRPALIVRSPAFIHGASKKRPISVVVGGRSCSSSMKPLTVTRNEPATEPQQSSVMMLLPRRRPMRSAIAAPMNGNSGIRWSGNSAVIVARSVLHDRQLVHVDAALVAEDADDDGEADCGLGGGHGDDDESERLRARVVM